MAGREARSARARAATGGRRPRRRRLVPLAVLLLTFFASWTLVAWGQQREPGFGVVTVGPHDGFYTEQQAERGAGAYAEHCMRCHGVDLDGIVGFSPPLAGERFLERWQDHTVWRLYEYVKGTMPLDRPASLDEHTYIDTIAYILRENGFPEASDELRPTAQQLGKLYISPLEAQEETADDEAARGPTVEPEAGGEVEEAGGEDEEGAGGERQTDPGEETELPDEESGVEPEAQ